MGTVGVNRKRSFSTLRSSFTALGIVYVCGVNGLRCGVNGQLLNHYPLAVQSRSIGVVILDSSGIIIGGGAGLARGPLSLGAREFFSATGSFSASPIGNAASALVSVVPTYPAPPTAASR